MKIVLFQTIEEAQAALVHLEATAKLLFEQAGYTVDGDSIVPKNAATGLDEPAKQRTTRWDDIKDNSDGWYFVSPRDKYPDHFDLLMSGNFVETEYEIVEVV